MIKINKITDTNFIVIVDGQVSAEAFKELVQRATNLWPDAPPMIKHFADEITNPDLLLLAPGGKLQDYEQQDTSPQKKQVERKLLVCQTCSSDNLIDVKMGTPSIDWKCSHCFSANHSEFK